jgi:hypothetical protein
MQLALPILEQIHNRSLSLYDETVSGVQAEALQIAARFFENSVSKITLSNNKLDDAHFAKVLDSLSTLTDFKSIAYA